MNFSLAHNEAAIKGRHHVCFRINDAHSGFPTREVEVLASREELDELGRDGFLVRESLLLAASLETLRAALDDCVARDQNLTTGDAAFGGTFVRHLADKHPVFLEMIDWAPITSVARALLGPMIQLRGLSGRLCEPDDPPQEVEWHFHQRLIPTPRPPFFSPPQTLDALLYLDDITELNGPLCVVPGSHRFDERALPTGQTGDLEEQRVLQLPAGSCVLTHGNLWHRAKPTLPGGARRRLLIFSYGPTWQKPSVYGDKPTKGLTAQLAREADDATRQLLGLSGWM